jgi:phosphoserine phosphatase RsbU/P
VSPDLVSREEYQTSLRFGLPFFAIACVTLVVGLSSLALAFIRSRDRLLTWMGVFSVLYAVRLLIVTNVFRDALGLSYQDISPLRICLTLIIPIPYALFALALLGKGWKNSIAIWLWIEAAFAVIGIPLALLTTRGDQLESINNILIIGGTVLVLAHLFIGRSVSFANSLKWPLIVCGVLVLLNNFGYKPYGLDIEPVGFLVLLGGLSWTAARSAIASERKLIDVEQELATARRIQNSIIPHTAPELGSLQLATRYQPMTSVAGDFFDFLKLSEERLTILVADVSGHGVPAALVASMLKVCFAALREKASDPAEVLAGLNLMLRGSLGGQYVTAACASIDLQGRIIRYAGAGHPASLLLRRDAGKVEQLAENGLFIGPFPMATYANIQVPFQAGDRLLLYTDGIVEATGPDGQEFGAERLERLLLESGHGTPAEFVEKLFQQIATPAQQDDLTVVVAQFH